MLLQMLLHVSLLAVALLPGVALSETVIASLASGGPVPGSAPQASWYPGLGLAVVSTSPKGTTYDQTPHTASNYSYADHTKFLVVWEELGLGSPGLPGTVLTYRSNIKATVVIPKTMPYTSSLASKPSDDPRLGSCGMALWDTDAGVSAGLLVTRKGVWAVYERRMAFIYVKRLAKAGKRGKDLQVNYNLATSSFAFLVDGKARLELGAVGSRPADAAGMVSILDLGQAAEATKLGSLSPVLGCFTFLDAADPNQPGKPNTGLVKLEKDAAYVVPTTFEADSAHPSWRLFGQGTALTVAAFKLAWE